MRSSNKQWIHPPDTLLRGHILYLVKFLGESEVEAPKGTDVVKDAIRKRKFNKSLRKTEGQRTPKVEISISVDGVKIQEPKTKLVKHEYPLHRISYCADDKSDKRMFTFIAKAPDTNQHYCYVFASDKNAEEITLTIGQAFDLAYRRFLESQGKDQDSRNQQLLLKKKVEALERENLALKKRIQELEKLKDREDIETYKRNKQQNSPKQSAMGRRLENWVGSPQSNGTNGTPLSPGIISPPPPSTRSRKHCPGGVAPPTLQDLTPQKETNVHEELASVFSSTATTPQTPAFDPFSVPQAQGGPPLDTDAFGMASFNPRGQQASFDGEMALNTADKDYLDLQAGFSQGLSFGTEEFGMNDFDPLSHSD